MGTRVSVVDIAIYTYIYIYIYNTHIDTYIERDNAIAERRHALHCQLYIYHIMYTYIYMYATYLYTQKHIYMDIHVHMYE